MAGKRLLDAALFLSASRTIARKHVQLRADQLDVWSKTSTVAKAVKNQTDRVTVTVAAAAALARRLNESGPSWAPYNDDSVKQNNARAGPQRSTADHTDADYNKRTASVQDHNYQQPEVNTTATQDSTLRDSSVDTAEAVPNISEADPQRAPVIPPKEPLDHSQGSDAGQFAPKSSTERPTTQNIKFSRQEAGAQEQEQDDDVPEGVNIDVFQNPRVSQMLGGPRKARSAEEYFAETAPDQADASRETSSVNDALKTNTVEESNVVHQAASVGQQEISSHEHPGLARSKAADAQEHDTVPSSQHQTDEDGHAAQTHQMHASRVPSTRLGRLWQYGGLATSMAYGAVGETFRRVTGSGSSGSSLMLSAANIERLVAKLSRMRGAALKLGQMISFQDSKLLPVTIQEVLQRVQDNADYMPPGQRDQVLASNLGSEWRSLFSSFNEMPIAAASIGQVHRATLASSGKDVAVKVQYPGVATSITSDLNNIALLLTASRLLPKGLYLDKTIANARTELAWECDYVREAEAQERFRALLADEASVFTVPAIVKEASGEQVLTAEFMHGTAVTKPSLNLTQEQRDWIGTQILRLCLRELTNFKFMQTDPNWTNFLYNKSSNKLELLDFGAAREYPDKFVNPYVRILIAASTNDRETIRDLSVQLGYLTGHESAKMVDAHVSSVMTLAEPFTEAQDREEVYDFRDQTITDRVRAFIPVMLRERLAPPPEETYSLHRKLSGAFLLLARLGSRVKCREMFVEAIEKWKASNNFN